MGLGFYHGNDQELNKTSFLQISLRFRSGSLPDMSTQEIHSKNYLTISAQKLYSSGEDSSCYEQRVSHSFLQIIKIISNFFTRVGKLKI